MTEQSTISTSLSEETDMNKGFPSCRPWKEMVQSLDLPSGFRNTNERIKTNLVYFRTNYMIILMLILICSFFYHPVMFWISLALLVCADAVFYRPYRKIAIVWVIFFVIFLVFVNEASAWNIKWTLLIEAVVVAAHASFRKTDDLSHLDQETPPLAIGLASKRPWKEMLRLLNLPTRFRNTIRRIKRNLVYFQTNYILILVWQIMLFSIIISISQILSLSFMQHTLDSDYVSPRGQWALFMAFLMFLYSIRTNDSINIRTVVVASSIIIVILVMVFDSGVWKITTTLLIEVVVVGAHSLLRSTDDLLLDDEQELVNTGLLTGP